ADAAEPGGLLVIPIAAGVVAGRAPPSRGGGRVLGDPGGRGTAGRDVPVDVPARGLETARDLSRAEAEPEARRRGGLRHDTTAPCSRARIPSPGIRPALTPRCGCARIPSAANRAPRAGPWRAGPWRATSGESTTRSPGRGSCRAADRPDP